jgi:hypothetical protein
MSVLIDERLLICDGNPPPELEPELALIEDETPELGNHPIMAREVADIPEEEIETKLARLDAVAAMTPEEQAALNQELQDEFS